MTAHAQQPPIERVPVPQMAPCLALRAKRAAAALDVSLGTFLKWVDEGKMPKGILIGGVVLYDFEAVRNAWELLKTANGEVEVNPFDR